MDKLNFSITINAENEKVWNTMFDEDSYRAWTEVFSPGSHYEGDWNEGSKILFLAPGETGKLSGMVSRIRVNRPYEYLSIEHLGIVEDGVENTSGEEAGVWAGALENYTFKDLGSKTELLVEMDSIDEYKEMFENMWPEALQKLKELAEKQV